MMFVQKKYSKEYQSKFWNLASLKRKENAFFWTFDFEITHVWRDFEQWVSMSNLNNEPNFN